MNLNGNTAQTHRQQLDKNTTLTQLHEMLFYRTLTSLLIHLVLLDHSSSEIFTNPFQLKAAFVLEHRLIKNITSLGISSDTKLGKAIAE